MSEEKKTEKAPIDFIEIVKKLWKNRKKYFIVLPATLIITYLMVLCVPRYYKCSVSLTQETSSSSSMSSLGSLGSLASSMGLSSLAKGGSSDAFYAEIYPNIIQSNDFIASLMTVEIQTQKGDIKTNYYTYLRDYQKSAWWDIVKYAIIELFKPTPQDNYGGKDKISVFNLTERQSKLFEGVQGNITCIIDKKTDVVSITVKDQDPLVCATMANATCKKLQEFIINYRTNKARIDYEYYKKLRAEAKQNYERARQTYASFADSNMETTLQSLKSKEEDLENEMQLKYNIYTTQNSQMQAAQAKLQEATPAFTMIQSATVPYKPAGPKRVLISLAMTILAFFVLSGYILAKEK
jgi:hypothetical protein